MVKRITLLLLSVVVLAGAGYIYLTKHMEQYVNQALILDQEQIYTIEPGASFNQVLSRLSKEQLILNLINSFPWYTDFTRKWLKLKLVLIC